MPTFMMRALVNGKMIGHPVEAEDEEEAKKKFAEALPFLTEQAKDTEAARASTAAQIRTADFGESDGHGHQLPVKNPAMDGRKFINIEFQCAACLEPLQAEFRDGYLQIAPCPTCLGELQNIVAASKRFLAIQEKK